MGSGLEYCIARAAFSKRVRRVRDAIFKTCPHHLEIRNYTIAVGGAGSSGLPALASGTLTSTMIRASAANTIPIQ